MLRCISILANLCNTAVKNNNYNKKNSLLDESTDEFLQYMDKILLCRTKSGKEFMSRLVSIEGNNLVFENKRGNIIKNPATSIVYFAEV